MYRVQLTLIGMMKISKLCNSNTPKSSILSGKSALTPILREIGKKLYNI
jgi:hypothetical protein